MSGMFLLPYGMSARLEWEVLAGLVSSHLLRMVIIRAGWLERPLVQVWPWVAVAVLLTLVAAQGIKTACFVLFTDRPAGMFLAGLFDFSLLLLPWTAFYFLYHQIQRSRRQCIRNKELQQRVSVMQEQCEQSGTDMEGMMARLQRIASLIEMDPNKSREEITEFSKFLRAGYMR